MFRGIFLGLVGLVFVPLFIEAHKARLGSCPSHEAMVNLDVTLFMGEWFVVRQSKGTKPCFRYTLAPESTRSIQKIRVYETWQRSINDLNFSNNKYLTFQGPSAADMKLHTGRVIDSTSTFTVLATDYDNYALVYICDNYVAMHRESIEIWSRQLHLHPTLAQEVSGSLDGKGLNLVDVDPVDQRACRGLSVFA